MMRVIREVDGIMPNLLPCGITVRDALPRFWIYRYIEIAYDIVVLAQSNVLPDGLDALISLFGVSRLIVRTAEGLRYFQSKVLFICLHK